MKLQYLAQVQRLLNDYDFQDKYKILLELEEQITSMEQNGDISREQLLATLGSPAEFVDNLIGTYDLSRLSEFDKKNSVTTDTADLLDATSTTLKTIHSQPINDRLDINDKKSLNPETSGHNRDQSSNSKSNSNYKNVKNFKRKNPFKFVFTVLFILFFVIAFFSLLISAILAIGIVFTIDLQTAISLLLGVLFLLITIGLILKLFKQIVEKIFNQEMKISPLIINLFLIVIFAFLAVTMLTSTFETVNMYINDNMNSVQNSLAQYNVDTSNIDWGNLDLSEFLKLLGDAISSLF